MSRNGAVCLRTKIGPWMGGPIPAMMWGRVADEDHGTDRSIPYQPPLCRRRGPARRRRLRGLQRESSQPAGSHADVSVGPAPAICARRVGRRHRLDVPVRGGLVQHSGATQGFNAYPLLQMPSRPTWFVYLMTNARTGASTRGSPSTSRPASMPTGSGRAPITPARIRRRDSWPARRIRTDPPR